MNKLFFAFFLVLLSSQISQAQFAYRYLNQADDREVERLVQTISNDRIHSSIRPLRTRDLPSVDSLHSLYTIQGKFASTWVGRKMLNERLVNVNAPGFQWRFDPLVDFTLSSESGSTDSRVLYTNTRGFIMEGKIGRDVSFVSSFRENQSLLPFWVQQFTQENRVVPGQGIGRKYSGLGYDFANATGMLTYEAGNYFAFTFGHGQNFIGEGHRSLFLSDAAFNYPFLKIETNVWRLKYINYFNFMTDIRPEVEVNNVFARKFTTMHYLSLNLGKRWNINFFESIVWADYENRGFDVNFLNPIIFYRPVEFAAGSEGSNALLGLGASYLAKDRLMIYGQFLLDEFRSQDIVSGGGAWGNKFGWQLGAKWYDAFDVDKLFLRFETNSARPYTYSHFDVTTNYGHYNQALAHPWGANFYEFILQSAYDFNRWGVEWMIDYGLQGNDDSENYYGRGIYQSYNDRPFDKGHDIARFNRSQLFISDLRLYWMMNPAIRLRTEIGLTYRSLQFDSPIPGELENQNHMVFSFGFRTNVFNRYYDF